jgi:hypothetical protein
MAKLIMGHSQGQGFRKEETLMHIVTKSLV